MFGKGMWMAAHRRRERFRDGLYSPILSGKDTFGEITYLNLHRSI